VRDHGRSYANVSSSDAPNEGIDTITDFVSGTDVLQFDHKGFGIAGAGTAVSQGAVPVNGAVPISGAPTFLYDGTAHLQWDPDGTGVAPATPIAVPTGHPALTINDIFFT
jgi:hypothetical protein